MYAEAEESRKQVLIENIYSILDSKIQYSEYELSQNVSKLQKESSTKPHSPISSPNWSTSFEVLLQTIEKNSREVQKLLLIRTKVNQVNADQIYQFIFEEDISKFEAKELEKMFV